MKGLRGMLKKPATWLERTLADRGRRRAFEEERLIIDVTERLIRTMDDQSKSRAGLAEALETTRPNVTQLLDGKRNMTLRTLARFAFELDQRVEVALVPFADCLMKPLDLGETMPSGRAEFRLEEFEMAGTVDANSSLCLAA